MGSPGSTKTEVGEAEDLAGGLVVDGFRRGLRRPACGAVCEPACPGFWVLTVRHQHDVTVSISVTSRWWLAMKGMLAAQKWECFAGEPPVFSPRKNACDSTFARTPLPRHQTQGWSSCWPGQGWWSPGALGRSTLLCFLLESPKLLGIITHKSERPLFSYLPSDLIDMDFFFFFSE